MSFNAALVFVAQRPSARSRAVPDAGVMPQRACWRSRVRGWQSGTWSDHFVLLGRLGRLRAASPCTRGLRTKEYIPGLGHRLAEVLADLLEGTREKRLSEGSVRFDDDEANRLRPFPAGGGPPWSRRRPRRLLRATRPSPWDTASAVRTARTRLLQAPQAATRPSPWARVLGYVFAAGAGPAVAWQPSRKS